MSTVIFGIDLGTTCSSIGLVDKGVPRLVSVDGQDTMPSVVSFPDGEDPVVGQAVVGQAALNQLALHPERTIRSAKRHMGTNHRWQVGDQAISAPQVSAHILRRLRAQAHASTGTRPEQVVITVPAWFTQAQRADTREAGALAGLDVQRIINEPTAAALAHAHGQDLGRKALVYDLGGGTFDVSLIEQDGSVVEVLASHGDTHLGGDDLDDALVDLVLHRLSKDDAGLANAIASSAGGRVRMRLAIEQAKIALSQVTKTTLRVPFVVDDRHLELALDRGDVEDLARPLIERTLTSVRQVLADSHTSAKDVDELLLVGGSSRLPLVWQMLRDELRLEGSAAIPPDLAVGLGAAIQGAIVGGSRIDGILVDVAPYALSVAAATRLVRGAPSHMICQVVTPRNSPLPSRHTHRFYTSHPQQQVLHISVFQGSHDSPLKNAIIGDFLMDHLLPAPAGKQGRPIAVEMRHDLDGLVHITVTDELSGRSTAGRVVADGDEDASLRASFLEQMGHLIPGTDLDDEPVAPTGSGDSVELSGDPQSISETFDAVIAARATLKADQPSFAGDLDRLARRGTDALARNDVDAAMDAYEELTDLLFELGVYL